jgi:hypothetical protein
MPRGWRDDDARTLTDDHCFASRCTLSASYR